MGIVEGIIFALVLGMTTGYQAGKAAKTNEVIESKKVCVDQPYQDRKAGCYELSGRFTERK